MHIYDDDDYDDDESSIYLRPCTEYGLLAFAEFGEGWTRMQYNVLLLLPLTFTAGPPIQVLGLICGCKGKARRRARQE